MSQSGRNNSIALRSYGKSSRLAVVLLAVALAVMLGLGVYSLVTVGVSVKMDGESIGTLSSRAQAAQVVSLVEEQVAQVLGEDFSLEAQVTTKPVLTLRKNVSNPTVVRSALMNSVEEVTNLYALTVDGVIIGAADSSETLQQVVENYAAMYTDGEARFTEDIAIYYAMVPSATEQNAGRISRALRNSTSVVTMRTSIHTESIPFDVEFVGDDTMYQGSSRIITPGEEGVFEYVTETEVHNSRDGDTRIIDSGVAVLPVTQVVAVGTVPRPATASYGSFIWPAQGVITSEFGKRSSGMHYGLDIAGRSGSDIVAADGGEVIRSDDVLSGYGNLVIIQHDDGTLTYYSHCQSLLVSKGDKVYRGQVIGTMGATGRATGVHLHFEVRTAEGERVDPLDYLPEL